MSYRDSPEEQRHLRIQGAEPDRFLGMLYRLAVAPGKCQAVAEIAVGCRGTRIEFDRPAKSSDRFLGAFFHEGQIAERDLSPGIAIIDGDRANSVLATNEQPVIAVDPAHMGSKREAKRQQASSRRVVGMRLNGPFESVDRGLVIQARQAPDVRLGPSDEFPGPEIFRGPRKRADALRCKQTRLDSRDDAGGDFILDGEDIAQFAVIALRPMMTAGYRIDQLRADAYPGAGAAYAAFEHVAHAKLARNLFHVDRAVLVDECRVAGDDKQPANAGQSGNQILGNAIGKVLLIGIAAHIGEWQYRNGRTVGQRQGAVPASRRSR